jgi:hypothetical protein
VIQELLEASHGALLVPLALLVALAVLAKGTFSLHRSKSQNRKEFLELWRGEHPDDLWLEVAVRHLVGEYMPAALIRSLRTSPQAGRALIEVAECWPLLEVDDETGQVRWRHAWCSTARRRKWVRRACWFGYYTGVGSGLFEAFALAQAKLPLISGWIVPVASIVFGIWCAWHAERLNAAQRSVPRWLGLP